MKSTKLSIALLAVASLLAPGLAGAQTNAASGPSTNSAPPAAAPRTRTVGADARLQALTAQLGLTEEQKPKVKAVLDDQAKQIQDMREEIRNATSEERRAKFQALNESTTAKLKGILTEEQFTKYQALPQFGRPRGSGPGEAQGAKPRTSENKPAGQNQ